MIYIEHRKNLINSLNTLTQDVGIEIDLRSSHGQIILSHDPFESGDNFTDWLDIYKRKSFLGPLILNTKEDGLEARCMELMKCHGVLNYLFLDTTFPTFFKHSIQNSKNFMLRLSKYEPFESVMPFSGKVEWLWVDCFDGEPPQISLLEKVYGNFKLCMVSPELQGYSLESKINEFSQIKKYFSAICTKHTETWKKIA